MKPKRRKLHKNICVAFARLSTSGDLLCRQYSANEQAKKAGGYLYFMAATGRHVSPMSAKFIIDSGLVEEEADGLFSGHSQTFRPVSFEAFEAFKSQYEAANA